MRPRLVLLAIGALITGALLAGCDGARAKVPASLEAAVAELFADPLVTALPPGVTGPDHEKVTKSCESGGLPFIARDFSVPGDLAAVLAFYREIGRAEGWHIVTDRSVDPSAPLDGADAVLVLERPTGNATIGFAVKVGSSQSGTPSAAVNGYIVSDRGCYP